MKNCGDVNTVGKIHAYLQQIGAINFGCGKYSTSSSIAGNLGLRNVNKWKVCGFNGFNSPPMGERDEASGIIIPCGQFKKNSYSFLHYTQLHAYE